MQNRKNQQEGASSAIRGCRRIAEADDAGMTADCGVCVRQLSASPVFITLACVSADAYDAVAMRGRPDWKMPGTDAV